MAKFRADGNFLFQEPERKGRNTKMGFRVATFDNGAGVMEDDENNAKIVAKILNGTRAKRIIKKLLVHIKPGSKQEERALCDILAAEKFLRDGP